MVVDEERFYDGYARVIGTLSAAAAVSGVAALRRRTRKLGAAAAALVTAAIADDVSNGPRVFRRATAPLHPTWNVVAQAVTRTPRGRSSCSPTTMRPRPARSSTIRRRPGSVSGSRA